MPEPFVNPQNSPPQTTPEQGEKELRFFEKRFFKIVLLAFLVLILFFVGFVVYNAREYIWLWYQGRQAMKLIQQQEQAVLNDTYGGKTPGETVQFFVAALRNNDIQLANKYIVLEDQRRHLKYLEQIKEAGNLPRLIEFLFELKKTGQLSDSWIYFTAGNKDIGYVNFDAIKVGNIWKLKTPIPPDIQ